MGDYIHSNDDLDTDLRSIQLDALPRLQPLRLDRMFLRARNWANQLERTAQEPTTRAPSPAPAPRIYPLPFPLDDEVENEGEKAGVSPLAKLFTFEDLAPSVLEHFEQPRELAVICRVCKAWCKFGRKKLYNHVWVRPWEGAAGGAPHFKARLDLLLFETLHQHPELCRLIRRLEVRFYPLAARGTDRIDLEEHVQLAVQNMVNLESLVWTRDKSVTHSFFETISKLERLRSLEITGHSQGQFDPSLIGKMSALEDLRIMMPDSLTKSVLVDAVTSLSERPGCGLKDLGLICQGSSLIDDTILKVMAPYLKGLRRLTLWGCSKATRDGVFAILEEAGEHIEELSLDALVHARLLDLKAAPPLLNLHTLSLTVSIPTLPNQPIGKPITVASHNLPVLPHLPSLTSLTMSASARPEMSHDVFLSLQAQLASPSRLRRLSLINFYITSADTLSSILTSNPALEELYITPKTQAIVDACPEIDGCNLRAVHLNVGLPERDGIHRHRPMVEWLESLAVRMPKLEQIGAGNMVLEVHRRLLGDKSVVELCRWSKPTTPGYFQVWRA
ncbi:hypothetical protein IAT38_008027 [Cryptococcus sp. DSM 104549]